MPSVHSSSTHMESPTLITLLKHTFKKSSSSKTTGSSSSSSSSTGGGLFRMLKLLPMLTTGCKVAALLSGGHRKPLLADRATTVTLFGHRRGRLVLAIQEDPHRAPIFVIELPILTCQLHREMSSDVLRMALETDTKTHRKRLLDEFVWAVYCNGRKVGHSIRRKDMTEDEAHVMGLLRGVSMGGGVLPAPAVGPVKSTENGGGGEGEMTYIRARFDRVVGSKNCESFYMMNPDGASGQELSIFFLRVQR